MTLTEYQSASGRTALYPNHGHNWVYPALGLVGEAGEVANKLKKAHRDNDDVISAEIKHLVSLELGDVLWYVAQLAAELGLSLESIAEENITKLASRHERGKLGGSGDQR